MANIALITGITGQDGSFLAEFLLEKGYEVHGIIRRSSSFNTGRIEHLYLETALEDMHKDRKVQLHYGDLTDSESLIRLIREIKPTEIYNLGAQSHVQVSFEVPEYTADCDATGVLRILEAVHFLGMEKTCRIYQASTSELFGLVQEVPQKETTPFYPRSPYAVAKMYGFWIMKNYRESYGMFCSNGILFNHESERRGETFVTRKITLAASRIAQGLQKNFTWVTSTLSVTGDMLRTTLNVCGSFFSRTSRMTSLLQLVNSTQFVSSVSMLSKKLELKLSSRVKG